MHLDPATTQFRLIALFAASAAAVVAAGCATARVASGWAPSEVVANGSTDDWGDKQVCSVMKDGLHLSVANDAERLYVMAKFRANDPQWSRAASRGGLTLRVVGPRKRTMSFHLPEGPERVGPGQRSGWSADSAQGETPRRMNPMRVEFEDKLVVTDVDKLDIPVPTDGAQGPAAGFSSENGMCVYEFSIPLQDSAFGHYSLGAGAGTGLNLTVTAGPSVEMRRTIQEQMRPHGRGGIGGGAGSGGTRRGSPGCQAIATPSVSVAVRLADGP